jgi:zinc/manganese transport system ATP-binding protein
MVVILKDRKSMFQLAVSNLTANTNSQNLPSIALAIDKMTVAYKDKVALQEITGHFTAGSLTAIIGPNGGGKSTLLKALLGLVPLASGVLEIAPTLQNSIAYLPQQCKIDRSFPLSVVDLAASGLYQQQGFFKRLGDDVLAKVKSALEQVGMLGCLDRSLNTLSGGQFQRVLFARLIVQNADVILLDEPFIAVDTYTMIDLVKIIQSWHQQKKTIIVVCHDLELVRDLFPETLLLARDVLEWGPTHRVLTPENLRAAKKVALSLECCDKVDHMPPLYELKL